MKTRKADWIEKEINEIRLDYYERTKHLSDEERMKQSRKESQALAKKYGFKIISHV